MAKSLSALKKRVRSIETTKKITNTMKLVSMSKFQSYNHKLQEVSVIFDGLKSMGTKEEDNSSRKIVLCVVPDLGLISVYVKQIISLLEKHSIKNILWIGTQGYEMVAKSSFEVLNDQVASETITPAQLRNMLTEYMENYEILFVKASISNHSSLSMEMISLSYNLNFEDNTEYVPNYDHVNNAYKKLMLEYAALYAKTNNKVMEHKLRQINMDKATESAQDMLDHLNNEYHKLRQEKITQEINEIVSGRM